MIRQRQSVHHEHSKTAAQTCDEDRTFKRHRNEHRPRDKWTTCDIEWIPNGGRKTCQRESADATKNASDECCQGYLVVMAVKTDHLANFLDWKWCVRVDRPITGIEHLLRRRHQLRGRVISGHHAKYRTTLFLHHEPPP